MKVITKERLISSLFAQIQTNGVSGKDGCRMHYDDKYRWCISAHEIEQAIHDIYSDESAFKVTHEMGEGEWIRMHLQYCCSNCRAIVDSRYDAGLYGRISFLGKGFCYDCGSKNELKPRE